MNQQTWRDNFTIREAVEADVSVILSFIQQLATYEKLLDEVVATEDTLRDGLFGPRQVAEVIIGEWQNDPVAFALFFHNFSTFLGRPGLYLEDLYVKPEMRGKGIGRIMLSYLAHLARKRNCGRLEWWVLDWNEPARKFYHSVGAVSMSEWTVQRITGQALEKLAEPFEYKQNRDSIIHR
jgi:GNAT superfamily N-acetyltransferase